MPFQTPLALAIYFTIWWTVLFAILPLGVHSMHEEGEVPQGFEPGAPVAPRLLMKAGLTTVVATIVFAALVFVVKIFQ
jgi:predicted secreted protein